MAYNASKNPFMDVSDDDFLASGKASKGDSGDPPPYYDDGSEQPLSPYERLQQQKQQSMNRQLDSTQRCLASIYDSEQIGIATAEELVHQGEQLDNIERKVDKINADTKVSQRHLNNIKSIFGGIKNWWHGDGKKDDATAGSSGTSTNDRTELRQTIAAVDRPPAGAHPAMRLRSDNFAGFYNDDVAEFGSESAVGGRRPGAENYGGSRAGTAASMQSQTASVPSDANRSVQWQEYEKSLNSNLEMMSGGVSQLKSLAVGLGNEIKQQNDQIDRIAPKVDRADTKVRDQNRQMRQILGK